MCTLYLQLLQVIYDAGATAYMNGHDHAMTVGNPSQPNAPIPYNGHTTFLTSGQTTASHFFTLPKCGHAELEHTLTQDCLV